MHRRRNESSIFEINEAHRINLKSKCVDAVDADFAIYVISVYIIFPGEINSQTIYRDQSEIEKSIY